MSSLISLEKALCGMGDLWGRLVQTEYLLLWWLARHLLYAGAAAALILYVPGSIVPVVGFFLAAHAYKMARGCFYYIYDNKKPQKEVSIARTEDDIEAPSSPTSKKSTRQSNSASSKKHGTIMRSESQLQNKSNRATSSQKSAQSSKAISHSIRSATKLQKKPSTVKAASESTRGVEIDC